MKNVAGDQFQPMVDGCCCNLEIGIRDDPSGLFQMRADNSKHLSCGNILAGRTS